MEVKALQNYRRHQLEDATVMVVGAGPSSRANIKHAFRIGVNPRHDGFSMAVAIDADYWDKTWRHSFAHVGVTSSHSPERDGLIRFTPPMSGDARGGAHGFAALEPDGVTWRGFGLSGFAAVAVARYLTRGAIVLAGFDLAGCDASGVSYAERQAEPWCAFLGHCVKVYRHPDMTGPLCEFVPEWTGEVAYAI